MSTNEGDKGPGSGLDEVTLRYDTDGRSVAFVLDESVYPRPVVYGAAYAFMDRCYVFLTRPAERAIRVRMKSRDPQPAPAALEALAGEFANELLDQLMRFELGEATAEIRKYYMARAFFGVTGSPSIDALLAELDSEEMADDALEIAVPWEQRSKDRTPEGSTGG